MTQVTFQNNLARISGNLPATGQAAPTSTFVTADLSDKILTDFAGERKVLNIFPNVDTNVYVQPVRTFSERASSSDNTVVLCISIDLSSIQTRFCSAEDLDEVVILSSSHNGFVTDYGIAPADSPLRNLTACTVLVLDENDKVLHSELVAGITNEPDYDAASAVS